MIRSISCRSVWNSTAQRQRFTRKGDDRISIEIPGVTDANEILSELGQPGSLYFIKEKDSDGNPNYGLDTSGHYVLAKSMDELKEEGSVVLTGTDIKSAKSGSYQDSTTGANKNVVQLSMTKEGTEKFAEATKAAKEAEETIAIYYDGELISVPRVNAEITDGQAIIEGSMEYEEAEQLASTIRIGGLSVELEEIRSNVVGAQLGEEAISTSLMAGAVGLVIVFVFMCVVYLLPGLASSLALVIYTGLILVLLNAFDITLTLPGIAGIILGIGMAVDANVIIFARVKEELTAGKSVKSALKCRIPQSNVCDFRWKHYNIDRGSSALAERKRYCQRICTDTGAWYRSFHVYSSGDHPDDRVCVLCSWNSKYKALRTD